MFGRLRLLPIAAAALFATTTATSVVATQASHPAAEAANGSLLAATAQIADAQPYPYHRAGYYHWHGRYWGHRRWHPGYWGPHHYWHGGYWLYF